MPSSTFHSLRMRVLSHGHRMEHFASQVGVGDIGLKQKLLSQAAPSLVAIIGNKGAGKTQLISHMVDVPTEHLANQDPATLYKFLHHKQFPPVSRQGAPEHTYTSHTSEYLKMLSFLEVQEQQKPGFLPVDSNIFNAEGILFLIDALDPWAGALWKHFENYAESHRGRIVVCVSKIGQLHKKDWPVLRKHLLDKISQITSEPLQIYELSASNLQEYEMIRMSLEDKAVGESKWQELCDLVKPLEQGFEQIERTLIQQQDWLTSSVKITTRLRSQLFELRQVIRLELLKNIETLGCNLEYAASSTFQELRQCLSNVTYLKSIIGKTTSLTSLQNGLRNLFAEALYEEIGQHYNRMNAHIQAHVSEFVETYPVLLRYCKGIKEGDTGVVIPFYAEEKTVDDEIRKVLAQLGIRNTFNHKLSQIDNAAAVKLKTALTLVIIAGICGSFAQHILGFLFLLGAIGLCVWCFIVRTREIEEFFDFLEDWLFGIGHNMSQPIDRLSTELINYAMDRYMAYYDPLIQLVKSRKEVMPDRLLEAKDLYKKNRDLLKELTETSQRLSMK